MNDTVKTNLVALIGVGVALLAFAGCQTDPAPATSVTPTTAAVATPTTPAVDLQAPPAPSADDTTAATPASGFHTGTVSGSIAYAEDADLTSEAVLHVELLDVSLQDAPSKLIAQQTIPNPGRAPVAFRIEYDLEAIQPGNIYAIEARIAYRDGSLGYINETAYEVLTNGRPSEVDMELIRVGPPPDPKTPISDASAPGEWVEVPATVKRVDFEAHEEGRLMTIIYLQPGGDDCSRRSSLIADRIGENMSVEVNNLEKRADDGSPACVTPPQEGEVELVMAGPFTAGVLHHVRVNDVITNAFTPPDGGLSNPVVTLSPIIEARLSILEIFPPRYQINVVSALPKGSSCSKFDGYAIERPGGREINVSVTHHETNVANIPCTEDYPMVETTIPLGSNFESGEEYTVTINGDTKVPFTAQ